MIIVTGLPRSATTTVTAFLASHKKVQLVSDGPEAHRLETDLLRPDKEWDKKEISDRINEVRAKGKIPLLKRPWVHVPKRRTEVSWLVGELGARIVIPLRSIDLLRDSWSTNAHKMIVPKDKRNMERIFSRGLKRFWELDRHNRATLTWLVYLIREQQEMEATRIAKWCRLRKPDFDYNLLKERM